MEAKFTNPENDEVRPNSNTISLENSRISSFNEEEKKENENNEENENMGNRYGLSNYDMNGMLRYLILRYFGFLRDSNENENRNNNQLNESSFYSFNENNNTIFGSTQLSIRESNNNSNTQSENATSNADLNNEEKNFPQELLICSGEKTEDKK